MSRFRVPLMRNAFVALLLLAAAAGCADGAGSAAADPSQPVSVTTSSRPATTSASESTAVESGPVEPTLPAAAMKRTDRGAKAFARYWVALVNYAAATGDTARLRLLSDTRCAGCRGLLRGIETPYGRGGHVEGGVWSIGPLKSLPLDHGADWAGFAEGQASPQLVVDPVDGSVAYRGGAFHFYSYLGWTESGWIMRWLRTPEPAE